MKIVNFDLTDQFRLPNPRIDTYFSRVEDGQPEDYRTPFFGGSGVKREVTLDRWQKILDANNLDGLMSGLSAFEREMRSKVGPLSVMLPLRDRMGDIEAYFTSVEGSFEPIDQRAIDLVISHCQKIKVRPKTLESTVDAMKKSTVSGTPYYQRKNRVVIESIELIRSGNGLYYWAIIGWRGQEGGLDIEDVKQRVVWMFPFSLSIMELSVYQPLIESWQANNINAAYISIPAVEEKISNLFDSKDKNDPVIVTDFSKFDQHFNSVMQSAAKEIIKSMLIDGDEWLEKVFPMKYLIPLIINRTSAVVGSHGMGSGSGGTNFDECCAHSALQHEAALRHGAVLNRYSNAYGDDGILTYPGITINQVVKTYTSHGMEMNPSKQSDSKSSAVYLRRYFHYNYRVNNIMVGVYSTMRALGRLLGQERYYNEKKQKMMSYDLYTTLRAWSIIENCNRHPLFDKFVDFVISGDNLRLGLNYPGFFDSLESNINKLMEIDPDAMGYTKMNMSNNTGIKSWSIYRYLSKKR